VFFFAAQLLFAFLLIFPEVTFEPSHFTVAFKNQKVSADTVQKKPVMTDD
jgi:hypothetical protein